MMGLLSSDFEDPRTQGILALGLGLLGGRGNFGQALAQAGAQGLGAYQGGLQMKAEREDTAMRRQIMQGQMAAAKAKAEVDARETASKNAMIASILGGGAQTRPATMDDRDVGLPGEPSLVGGQRTGPLARVPQEAILADYLFNDGKKLSEFAAKYGMPDMQVAGGFAYDRNNLQSGFLPSMTVNPSGQSIVTAPGADGIPRVGVAPGGLEAYQSFKNIDAETASRNDLVEVLDPAGSGRMVRLSRQQVLDAANPSRQSAQPAPMPSRVGPSQGGGPTQSGAATGAIATGADRPKSSRNPGGFDPYSPETTVTRVKILQDEFTKAAAAGRTPDMEALTKELRSLNAAPARGGPMASGISLQERAALEVKTDADKDINANWLKTIHNPVIQAGESAGSALVEVRSARNALANVGDTGFGSEAKVAAASVLGSLGVAGAKEFAGNAQAFRQAAMARLDASLKEATGTQTEGDAQRAAQLFASLGNTPKANAFILDMVEARAERNRIRAAFYRDALPLARAGGDLSEVDRRWAASRANTSVFDMPSMRKWGVK